MPNRCVAAGCGDMPSDSVHFSVFLKIHTLYGSDKFSERGWIGSLARRVDCFHEIPAPKEMYALLYNVTVS